MGFVARGVPVPLANPFSWVPVPQVLMNRASADPRVPIDGKSLPFRVCFCWRDYWFIRSWISTHWVSKWWASETICYWWSPMIGIFWILGYDRSVGVVWMRSPGELWVVPSNLGIRVHCVSNTLQGCAFYLVLWLIQVMTYAFLNGFGLCTWFWTTSWFDLSMTYYVECQACVQQNH